jgi:hypothetical protein
MRADIETSKIDFSLIEWVEMATQDDAPPAKATASKKPRSSKKK